VEASGQLHILAALPPKKDCLGRPQTQSGYSGEKENSITARNWTQTVEPVASLFMGWAIPRP